MSALESWDLEGNQDLHEFREWPVMSPFRDPANTNLTSPTFCNCWGKFGNPFLISMTQNHNHEAPTANFCCILGLEYGPLAQLHLQNLSVFSMGSFIVVAWLSWNLICIPGCLKYSDPLPFVTIVWKLKTFITIKGSKFYLPLFI